MRVISRIALALVLVLPLLGGAVSTRAEELWKTLPDAPPMPAPTESGTADANGVKLYYAIYGSGDPVLLLHGGLGHSDVWGNQIPAFAAKYKVVAIDSRGHGRSTRDEQPYSYDLMADDVVALMDRLNIEKASIVGWSDGAIIGLDIAIRHPERLDKLFAFGANYNISGLKETMMTDPVFNAAIERTGKDYERLSPTPKDFQAFVDQISQMWMTQPDFSADQLGSIKAPTLIAAGEYDEAVKREHTEEMARLIPGAKLVFFPETSHFALWQNSEMFNRAVLEFLQGS